MLCVGVVFIFFFLFEDIIIGYGDCFDWGVDGRKDIGCIVFCGDFCFDCDCWNLVVVLDKGVVGFLFNVFD